MDEFVVATIHGSCTMATRRSHKVSTLPVTEELFMEFLKENKVLKGFPFYLERADSTTLKLAATWLLNLLQSLNSFLLEKEQQ